MDYQDIPTRLTDEQKGFYLTAFADRFLVGSKESIMTPQGGRGGIREFAGSPPRTSGSAQIAWDILEKSPGDIRPEPTVGHFVVFEFPELHSRATFWMPGAKCRTDRFLMGSKESSR